MRTPSPRRSMESRASSLAMDAASASARSRADSPSPRSPRRRTRHVGCSPSRASAAHPGPGRGARDRRLQPVSRPEVARIRGVSSDSAVGSLMERGMIEERGGPSSAPSPTARRRCSRSSSGSRGWTRCPTPRNSIPPRRTNASCASGCSRRVSSGSSERRAHGGAGARGDRGGNRGRRGGGRGPAETASERLVVGKSVRGRRSRPSRSGPWASTSSSSWG